MAQSCDNYRIVDVYLDVPFEISDTWFTLLSCAPGLDEPYQLKSVPPWGSDIRWVGNSGSFRLTDPAKVNEYIIIDLEGGVVCEYISIKIERCFPVPPRFADVAISRRYGGRLYLSGKLERIVDTDEICILYSRPGSSDLLNLKDDTSGYTYIKNASGQLTFETLGKYLDFNYSGYYILEAWDVTDNCETRSQKRASWVLNVTQTKYQYQLYFDVDAPELGDKAYLLQAEWDKYNSWKPYRFTFEEPDCFPLINGTQQTTPQQVGGGWLCQAAEPLGSGCAPLPWWMCRSWTNWDIYMRGECSCDHFQNTLKPLGIPCHHLIAMYREYGSEPPYCGYVKCP